MLVVDQEQGSEAPPCARRAPVYSQPYDAGPLTSSRLVAIARRATDIASQARGIDHGDILLGVAGTSRPPPGTRSDTPGKRTVKTDPLPASLVTVTRISTEKMGESLGSI